MRHVSLRANNSDGAVGINQSPHGEIAHCDIGGGPGGQGMTKGRCVWCLATSHAISSATTSATPNNPPVVSGRSIKSY